MQYNEQHFYATLNQLPKISADSWFQTRKNHKKQNNKEKCFKNLFRQIEKKKYLAFFSIKIRERSFVEE